jgi:hypothetical protein
LQFLILKWRPMKTRHEAKQEAITYAPNVQKNELEQYREFANTSRGWLFHSRKIFDKLEPGQNRSMNPQQTHFHQCYYVWIMPKTRSTIVKCSFHNVCSMRNGTCPFYHCCFPCLS